MHQAFVHVFKGTDGHQELTNVIWSIMWACLVVCLVSSQACMPLFIKELVGSCAGEMMPRKSFSHPGPGGGRLPKDLAVQDASKSWVCFDFVRMLCAA
jgi:hypothetical protein